MADFHQIIDGVRLIFQSGQLPDDVSLRSLAEGYAAACAEANERLNTCTRFLQQGLRAEAIHQAEIEPNLLNMLASLDFPERAEWDELTEERALPFAHPLNFDAARALNEAYAQHDPLRELFRLHRRMALAQAPLSKRLTLLRKIAVQDSGNPIWQEDIQKYEQARITQLAAEVSAAAGRGDAEALEGLAAEFEDPSWTTSPPAALVRKIQDELAHLRRVQARRALESLAGDLLRAFGAKDLAVTRELRNTWDDHASLARLADGDPLIERVRPVLAWVEAEDQREASDRKFHLAVAALREALAKDNVSYQSLTTLGEAVRSCGRGMPGDLSSRQKGRLRELTRRWWRKTAAIGIVATVVTVTAAVVLVQAVRSWKLGQDAQAAVAAVNEFLEQGDIEGAEAFRSQLSPTVAAAPELAEPFEKLDAAHKVEDDRKERFNKALAEIAAREPDAPDPPGLSEIRKLIRLEQEKKAFEEALSKYHERYAAAQADVEGKYRRDVAKVGGEMDKLESLAHDTISSPEVDNQSTQVESHLKPLLDPRSPKISNEARQAAVSIQSRLESVRKDRSAWKQQSGLEEQITRASTMRGNDPALFVQSLDKYAETFPESPRAKDFKKVVGEQSAWGGVLAWMKAFEFWKATPLLGLDPPASAVRLKDCQRILADYPGFPDAPLARRYQSYLEAVARREGLAQRKNGKSIGVRADLETVWKEDFAARLQVVTTNDKRHYYYIDDPREKDTARIFRVYTDVTKEHMRDQPIPKITILSEGRTPQCFIADHVNEENLLQKKPWEEAMLILVRALAGPRSDARETFDPVFRFSLLKRTVDLAAEGSMPLDEAVLKPFLTAVGQARIDVDVAWMNPDDNKARDERKKAEDFFRKLPSLNGAEEEVRKFCNRLEGELSLQRVPVGWLIREGATWRVQAGRSLAAGVNLWIVTPSDGGSAVWENVGAASGRSDSPVLTGDGAGKWVQGRPVFAEVQPVVSSR